MGKMIQHSYMTGSMLRQTFDAARNINIQPQTTGNEELREHIHRIVALLSLIWNVCKAKLPLNAIADFERSVEDLPRCD